MREAAEDRLSADPVLGEVDPRWAGMSLSLMPQHQQLGILAPLTPGQYRQAAEQATHEQITQR